MLRCGRRSEVINDCKDLLNQNVWKDIGLAVFWNCSESNVFHFFGYLWYIWLLQSWYNETWLLCELDERLIHYFVCLLTTKHHRYFIRFLFNIYNEAREFVIIAILSLLAVPRKTSTSSATSGNKVGTMIIIRQKCSYSCHRKAISCFVFKICLDVPGFHIEVS